MFLEQRLKTLASTSSLEGGRKYLILDESDYLNPQSTQPALRGFIEEFSKNCRFVLTCNYKNRIIEPLHSRCAVVEFSTPAKSKPKLASSFFGRAQQILDTEGIEYDPKVLAQLINKHFPDWRRVLNELQRYAVGGKIDSGILATFSDVNIEGLMRSLAAKNFKEVRKWVVKQLGQ